MQAQWAINNYQLKGDEQDDAFIKLIEEADIYVADFPADAPTLIWRGIVNSSYAGVSGGLGALKYAKAARADLEAALELQPDALEGSAYTSLGTLFFSVPGWPIGFGDDDKAEELLKKALEINPDGIDSNYFFADYLTSEKRYDEAREYYNRALNAAPRAGREIADQGRRGEIQAALKKIEKR
ncbi:MAG: tetratricopeptide (TPR) repeat protein [Bacteroidia bacterium]|jgi:tetratricopeptide (TPR) repeat protein